jgi:hypothetical protein
MITQWLRRKTVWGAGLLLAMLAVAWLSFGGISGAAQPALAAPDRQLPIYTPTPGPDGQIIWIVKPNDTLLTISLITGVPVEMLRSLNNLTGDTIFEGQKLLIGMGGPAEVTSTPGPTPTPTEILPTPTPKPGQGTLCILLFNDLSGDSIRQEGEPSIPDGAISFGNRVGTVSKTVPSGSGTEHQCFTELPEGEYTVSVAVPAGYNPTTDTSYEFKLVANDQIYINFGAQVNSQTQAEESSPPAEEGRRSPWLGIVGGLFLLAGIGVALFAGRMMRAR